MTTTVTRDLPPTKPQGRAAWAETFQLVLAELRQALAARQPERIAAATGAEWKNGEFRLHCLDEAYRITWPALVAYPLASGEACAADVQGLFLYYFATADGTPPADRWLSFRELPNGWLYHQAFQGYTGHLLVQALGNDLDAFKRVALASGGQAADLGDAGYRFDALPSVRLAVVYWLGDEEFAPHAQVLFDAAAGHYLPIDGLAMLGHRLIRRLLEKPS